MSNDSIDDPIDFVTQLGNLRNAGLESVSIEVADQLLYLVVDDLYAALEESPDYPGERPSVLIFLNVTNFRLDVDASDGLRISALRVIETPTAANPFALEIDLNIGGGPGRTKSLTASFAALELEDLEEEDDDEDEDGDDDTYNN
jgi:hypothetical protein